MDTAAHQLIKQTLAKHAAEQTPEQHHLRRFMLGNPASSAIEAAPGSRMDAAGEAWEHGNKEVLKGMGEGAGIGALAGGALGATQSPSFTGTRGQKSVAGAIVGSMLGLGAGSMYGGIKGSHGQEASRIHGARSPDKSQEERDKPGLSTTGKGMAMGFGAGGLAGMASASPNVRTFPFSTYGERVRSGGQVGAGLGLMAGGLAGAAYSKYKGEPKDGDGDGKINDGKEDEKKEGAYYEYGVQQAVAKLGL